MSAEVLEKLVGDCAVLLAVIGDRWLDASDADGKRRLDDPRDYLRIEIEFALKRGIAIIPVLVKNAQMPSAASLPSQIEGLAYRNAIQVRPDPDFHRDVDRLIAGLEAYLKR